jgi:hypothetical protein
MSGNVLADGAGQLRHAQELLLQAWRNSQDGWDDVVRQQFEEERMEPLFDQLRAALDATQQFSEVLRSACRHAVDKDREGR